MKAHLVFYHGTDHLHRTVRRPPNLRSKTEVVRRILPRVRQVVCTSGLKFDTSDPSTRRNFRLRRVIRWSALYVHS